MAVRGSDPGETSAGLGRRFPRSATAGLAAGCGGFVEMLFGRLRVRRHRPGRQRRRVRLPVLVGARWPWSAQAGSSCGGVGGEGAVGSLGVVDGDHLAWSRPSRCHDRSRRDGTCCEHPGRWRVGGFAWADTGAPATAFGVRVRGVWPQAHHGVTESQKSYQSSAAHLTSSLSC